MDFPLPLGLYDREKIVGPVVLRRGGPEESYQGLGDRTIHVSGRYVLSDESGPFGSPVADSLRTSVSENTTKTVMTLFAPTDYEQALLSALANTAAQRMMQICGGRVVRVDVLEEREGE